jgi:hypothetical protein
MLIVFSMNTPAVFYFMRFSLYLYNRSSLDLVSGDVDRLLDEHPRCLLVLMRSSLSLYNKSSLFQAMLIVFSMNTPGVFLTQSSSSWILFQEMFWMQIQRE